MLNSHHTSNVFFFILFFVFFASVLNMYNKFIIKEDFHYFLTEEEIPGVFDLSNYPD